MIPAFLLWLATTYTSARWSVEASAWALRPGDDQPLSQERFAELTTLYRWPARLVPVAAPLLVGGIVVYALSAADSNLPCLLDGYLVDPTGGVCPHNGTETIADEVARLLERTPMIAAVCVTGFLVAIIACCTFTQDRAKEEGFWPAFLPAVSRVRSDGSIPLAQPGSRIFAAMLWIVAALLVAILGAFILCPDLAVILNRAMLAFLLFAVWVPFFTLIARTSHRIGLPLVLLVLAFPATALLVWSDNHLVRTVPTARGEDQVSALVRQRPQIEEWIAAWKRASCADGMCPPPILIAASGGASRAGLFTASGLGKLMDATCTAADKRSCVPGEAGLPRFVNQTFAISPITGSTLGASAWLEALERAQAIGSFPCRPNYVLPGTIGQYVGEFFNTLADLEAEGSKFGRLTAFQLHAEIQPLCRNI